MKEKKAIKDYFDKKKRKPCHVGHIEHTKLKHPIDYGVN